MTKQQAPSQRAGSEFLLCSNLVSFGHAETEKLLIAYCGTKRALRTCILSWSYLESCIFIYLGLIFQQQGQFRGLRDPEEWLLWDI